MYEFAYLWHEITDYEIPYFACAQTKIKIVQICFAIENKLKISTIMVPKNIHLQIIPQYTYFLQL